MRALRRGASVLLLLSLGCAGADRGDGSREPAPTRIDSLVRLGDSTYRSDRDSASRLWQLAHSEASAVGDSVNIARSMTGLGMAARLSGDWPESRRLGEQALALKLRFAMSPRELFRSYNALALLAWNQERLADAGNLLSRAIESALRAGDSTSLGMATINAGLVAKDLGAFDRARRSFESGRDIARAHGDSVNLGRAFNNLGMLDIALGDPLSAVASLEQARQLARAHGDNITEVNARGQLANAYQALGEPQRAFALLDSALAMAQQQGQPAEVAEDLTIIADLYVEAGDYQHALDYYRQALVITDSLGLPEERGDILRSSAIAQAALGNLTAATQQAREALRIHRDGGFVYPELEDLLVLTNLAARRQAFDEANAYLRDATRVANALEAPIASAQVAIATADAAARNRQWNRVLQVLDSTRSTLYLAGSVVEADALSLLAQAHAELGRSDAALAAGRLALDAIERVRANYGTQELRTAFTSQKSAVFARQALLMLRMGRTDDAFEVADAARGRALLEHLMQARSDLQTSGASSTLLERDALLRRIDVLVGQLRVREQTPPRERSSDFVSVTGSLRDSVENLRTAYTALLARSGRPDLVADRLGQSMHARPAAPQIRKALQSGELLLEYLVTEEQLLLFAVTSSGVHAHVIDETAASLTGRVQLARDLLRRQDSGDRSRTVLRALFDILLGPVVRSGALERADRLIIVPHGVLTYLPFAALVHPANEYVAQRHVLLHLPTSAVLPMLRRTPVDAKLARVRAEVFAPLPTELPATEREANSVAESVRGAVVRLGADASERKFRQSLGESGIVHVASHATLNSRNPMFTSVEFARSNRGGSSNNGRLELHELLGARSNASLVFLSGCETAVGSAWSTQFDTGEDFATLSQAFLLAGARNVVATLWRIDDVGASEFAGRFYEGLSDGYADALAKAQRQMIESEKYRSPYFWAAYQLSGSGLAPSPRKTGARVR